MGRFWSSIRGTRYGSKIVTRTSTGTNPLEAIVHSQDIAVEIRAYINENNEEEFYINYHKINDSITGTVSKITKNKIIHYTGEFVSNNEEEYDQ